MPITQEQFDDTIQRMSALARLDPNRVEFEDIREALLFQLSQRESLTAFLEADTITFLVDAIASVGAYTQYSVDVAWSEGNLVQARIPQSIRSIIRTLGVRQRRKIPSSMTVRLSRSETANTETIPSFSTFSVASENFFNRDVIEFGVGEGTITATLYQGTVVENSFTGANQDYSRYVSQENRFLVSEDDVQVFVNRNPMMIVKRPLWNFRNIYAEDGSVVTQHDVVQDFTLSDGSLELRFGSRLFGRQLNSNDVIQIRYATTRGRAGRDIQVLDSEVEITTQGFTSISGTVTTILSGGFDEISTDTYKNIGPLAFSAQQRAIDPSGYRVLPLEHPGVIDCVATRQAHYAPDDITFANYIRISLLTSVELTDTYWNGFVEFLSENSISTAKYLRYDPIPNIINISANVHIRNDVNSVEARNVITRAIESLLEPKFGLISLNVYKSDIVETITNAVPGVNFVELLTPVNDVFNQLEVPEITNVAPSSSGSLAIGRYQYYITVQTVIGMEDDNPVYGESLPTLIVYQSSTETVLTSTGSISITVGRIPFGTGITIYRTHIASDGTETTVKFNTIQDTDGFVFADDGSMSGTQESLPTIDTSGIFYPRLGTLSLNMINTARQELVRRGIQI